jgi:prepilin-type N-terminal cleavage/methylation domain-containing protein
MKILQQTGKKARRNGAFTLVEVAISMAIAGIAVGGIVFGYLQAAKRAEWSAYSLAAHSLAIQRLEQTRAAQWDPTVGVDELITLTTNGSPAKIILDVPRSGTNRVYGTVTTSITNVIINSQTNLLRMITVQCVWPFPSRGWFTNTITTYRAPVQ